MRYLFILFVFMSFSGTSQTITVMDFVQVKENRRAEAIYFYEHNWKLYRDIALKKGFILSYRLEEVVSDSAGSFNLVLITEYRDSSYFQNSETNFREILSTARPNDPLLLNELQPADFRTSLFVKITRNLYRSYPPSYTNENPGHLEYP